MMYTNRMKGFVFRTSTIYLPEKAYRVFSTSGTRPSNRSCNDANKVMLITAIESIYNEDWRVRGVFPFMKVGLQGELLVKDNITLEPMDYYQSRKSGIPDFLYEILVMESINGYLWLNEWVEDDVIMIGVYKCRKPTDLFLMTALTRVLLKKIREEYQYIAPITTNVSTLNDIKCRHYAFLNRQRNVVKLIKIDLTPSIKHATNSRILKYFDNETCKGVVLNLVKQILYLPIYDILTNNLIPFKQIPPIGEITNVILHIFYQKALDKVIEEKYPGITYSRWGHEVIIAIKKNDSFTTIDYDTVVSILDEIDLHGNVELLSYGDYGCLPACYGEKAILLHEDGCVSVWRYEDL